MEQVEAYEEEHGLKYAPPKKECFTHRAVFMRIYEASDGFHGSHDEVLEHERKLKRKEIWSTPVSEAIARAVHRVVG